MASVAAAIAVAVAEPVLGYHPAMMLAVKIFIVMSWYLATATPCFPVTHPHAWQHHWQDNANNANNAKHWHNAGNQLTPANDESMMAAQLSCSMFLFCFPLDKLIQLQVPAFPVPAISSHLSLTISLCLPPLALWLQWQQQQQQERVDDGSSGNDSSNSSQAVAAMSAAAVTTTTTPKAETTVTVTAATTARARATVTAAEQQQWRQQQGSGSEQPGWVQQQQ